MPNKELDVLVDNDTKHRFELNAKFLPNEEKDIELGEEDLETPLKGIATDFVINEFFKSPDSLHRFTTHVYHMFEEGLEIYRNRRGLNPNQVIFLYKGGNVLRIVSREFMLELPASATRSIEEFYAPFFKRGDADFTIYLDPDVEDYDDIYYELGLLSYLIQDNIRTWFMEHLMRYFDFFRYNSEYKKSILREYLDLFNDAEGFKGDFVDLKLGYDAAVGRHEFRYHNNVDKTVRFVDLNEDWDLPVRKAYVSDIQRSNSFMTVTHNNALDFPAGTDNVRVNFNLTRTKVIFTLLKTDGKRMNVGGELIDVSMTHKNEDGFRHFADNLDKYIATYNLKSGDCNLEFKSYTVLYLTEDLEKYSLPEVSSLGLTKNTKRELIDCSICISLTSLPILGEVKSV